MTRRVPARPRRVTPDDLPPTRPRARVLTGWAAGRVGFLVETFRIKGVEHVTIFFPDIDHTVSVKVDEIEEAEL